MPASAPAGTTMPATAIMAAATHPEMCPARQNIMFRPFPLLQVLADDGGHFISGGDHLGIHFVSALRRYQLGDFLHRIDVRRFQITLLHVGEAFLVGIADNGLAGGRRFLEEVVADRLKARLVDEVGKRQLAKHGRIRGARQLDRDFAGAADGQFGRACGNSDAGKDLVAVNGDELALVVLVEGAGTGIERGAIGRLDLEEALADQRHVEIVAGLGEFALEMQIAHRRRLNTETDIGAFRDHGLVGAVGHTLGAFGLIEQIRELGAGPLEACRVDVGDVVGDDFQIGLLGIHARCCNGERSHVFVLKSVTSASW
ncbi:hypothetical protein RHECNPAF_1760034 [Rhizobium etli CNPAF512]|nr:hypothetical protein RHECNPAF_1760034 [Rhizobium etli CNPAF512]